MKSTRDPRNGQALVMVTLALLAMFGIIGLAVDLGWAFHVKRSAQAAADAAALAAVIESAAHGGGDVCGPNTVCQPSPWTCPAPPITDNPEDNLDNGCMYARQNGFASAGRQLVTMQSNVPAAGCFPNCVPTAPGVHAHYWVTARVSEQIPQLFSAVLGHSTGIASARATAVIADMPYPAVLILLNRKNDPYIKLTGGSNDAPPQGTNLYLGGNDTVTVPGGIALASNAGGSNANGAYAGDFKGQGEGQGQVYTPYTWIQGSSGQGGLPSYAQGKWQNWYQNQQDGSLFRDPFEGLGQPPIGTNTTPIPVPDGNLTTTVCPNYVCPAGIYFATTADGTQATGAPIVMSATDQAHPWQFRGGSFGEFTFFGGLVATQNAAGSNVDFGPGRYVLAGVSTPGAPVFDTANKTTVTGGGMCGGAFCDAGRMFILTDSTYPGLDAQIQAIDTSIGRSNRLWDQLSFGISNFKAGLAGGNSSLNLYGLDRGVAHPGVNAEGSTLQDFGNVVVWQDQRNSNVKYQTDGAANVTNGYFDTSCGDIENLCRNTPVTDRSMGLSANQASNVEGVVYQPRGAWATVWAGTGYSGPITLISGGIYLQGTVELTLLGARQPLTRLLPALVE